MLQRQFIFKIHGFEFKPTWSLKAFKANNRLQGKPVDDLYQNIKEEFSKLFQITVKNLRRSTVTKVESRGRKKDVYHFKSGFVPVKMEHLETKDFILDIDFFNAKKAS